MKLLSTVVAITTGLLSVESAQDAPSGPTNSTARRLHEACHRRLDSTDFPGFDIGSVPARSGLDCYTPCENKPGCKAFTWTDYNGGTCWLKSNYGTAVTLWGANSGFIDSEVGNNFCINVYVTYLNCDMPGNDIDHAVSDDPYDCQRRCSELSGCFAATWTDFKGGTCWRKSAPTRCVYAQNGYSIVVPYTV